MWKNVRDFRGGKVSVLRGGVRRPWLLALVCVLSCWLVPSRSSASIIELTLDSDKQSKLGSYNHYMWDPGTVWEIPYCPIGGLLYFTKVISVYESNEIGMHLLNVEENDSYVFNLGTVLIATFGASEDFRNSAGGSSGLPEVAGQSSDYLNFSAFKLPSRPNSGPPPVEMPELSTLTTLLLLAPLIRRSVRGVWGL